MVRSILIAAMGVALCAGAANPVRLPVLVELFTSEGCSSCPPADRLLQLIDPQVIVLSEHVDYWDRQGWKDRFSSHALTERQADYARQFGVDSPYTPQIVVDGAAQVVGSDAQGAAQEIEKASHRAKATVKIDRTGSGIAVEIDSAPSAADIMVAVADDSDVTQVAAGENKGHELHHVAVVRSLRKIGAIKRGGKFSTQIKLPQETVSQRVVVFLQESGRAQVSGAAMLAPASYKPAP
jgi:hypothetical protein